MPHRLRDELADALHWKRHVVRVEESERAIPPPPRREVTVSIWRAEHEGWRLRYTSVVVTDDVSHIVSAGDVLANLRDAR